MSTATSQQALLVVVRRMGGSLLPDNDQYKNRFQIRSASSSRLYVVAQRKSDGEHTCGCPGWIRHRHCKHLDTIVPMLEAAAREAVKNLKR
jgi:hypothetical protein